MDFVKALKKAPAIKRATNKNWALDMGGGGSIFDDDIFGNTQSKKKEEEKKEDNKLNVDESKILSYTTYKCAQ